MILRFATLNENWSLKLTSSSQVLLTEKNTGQIISVSEDMLYVLNSCDGCCDFSSFAFLPKHRSILNYLILSGVAAIVEPEITGALWAITGCCNLRCLHCYMEAPKVNKFEPSFDDLMKILDSLSEARIEYVILTGGEPFIRSDFFQLIDKIIERHINIDAIYTNALLVSDEVLSRFSGLGINPSFLISFDGIGAHDHMRGVKGVENQTLEAIERIIQAGFSVKINTSVTETCLPGLMKTYEKMKLLGVSSWGIARPQPIGNAKNAKGRLDNDLFAAACEEIQKQWIADERPFTIALEAFFSAGAGKTPEWKPPEFNADEYTCKSCRKCPYITYDGVLMPCPTYEKSEYALSFPNLLKDDWQKAWNNPVLRRLLDIKRNEIMDKNPECAACQYISVCGTGCRASALRCGNGLYGKDEFCCTLLAGGYKDRFSLNLKG